MDYWMLPTVVRPGTWAGQPAYYEKLSLLAVTQTPEAHAEVEEFLKNLKAATVQARDKQSSERVSKAPAKQTDVVPAHLPPVSGNPVEPARPGRLSRAAAAAAPQASVSLHPSL